METKASVLSRVLFTAMTIILLSLTPACGGGDSAPPGVESESEAESEAEGQESESESESESECESRDCDDDVDCTDDRVDRETCACAHEPDQAFCFLQDTGTICDVRDGCITPQVICNTDADCPDLEGGCLIGSCDLSVASCQYASRDLDDDGHPVQTCDKIGGDDCNDTDPQIYPGARERCDGRDNDCDSVTDGMSDSCGTDDGECVAGTRTCTDGDWSSCSDVGPTGERCNGLDDDCDGEADENWPLSVSCDGLDGDYCEEGVYVCNASGTDVGCTDATGTNVEICNGFDDDCNGAVDENWPTLSAFCDGVDGDLCVEGVYVCNAGGTGVICSDTTSTNVGLCNGRDDDCDGLVDEDFGGISCGDAPTACVASVIVECNCCDGLDNDGDGFTDSRDSDCVGDFWCPTSTTNAPSARLWHTAIWTGSEMIVWGGYDGDSSVNTGGRYNPLSNSWTTTAVMGVPSARSSYTAVWTDSEMIVWGGDERNTVSRYNPVTNSWVATSTVDAPSVRNSHTAIWTGSEMIVWGGGVWDESIEEYTAFNTGGRYNPTTNSWTATSGMNAPSARSSHTAVWTDSEMIVWGGDERNTVSRYNPVTNSWVATSTVDAPSVRNSHTAIWTGSEMIVWGGDDGDASVNTGGRYNPATNTWVATSITNAPSERNRYSAVWSGSEMIVWGGYNYDTGGIDCGRYNSVANTWIATSTMNAPSDAQLTSSVVWTGSEMIVWGGLAAVADGTALNTGGRYTP